MALPRPRKFTIWSERWQSSSTRLECLEATLRLHGVVVLRGGAFDRWDLEVRTGMFGGIRLLTAIEEHGSGKQVFRVRVWPHSPQRVVGLGVIFVLLCLASDVLQPWPIKIMVDHVLRQQPVPNSLQVVLNALPGPLGVQGMLLWVCTGTVLMFAASTLMAMVHTRAAVRLGQRTVYELGAELFLHLQRLSLRFHTGRSVGDLIARVMRDSYCMHSMMLEALLPGLHSVAMQVALFI